MAESPYTRRTMKEDWWSSVPDLKLYEYQYSCVYMRTNLPDGNMFLARILSAPISKATNLAVSLRIPIITITRR